MSNERSMLGGAPRKRYTVTVCSTGRKADAVSTIVWLAMRDIYLIEGLNSLLHETVHIHGHDQPCELPLVSAALDDTAWTEENK